MSSDRALRHIASFRCTAVLWLRGVTPSGRSIAASRCRVASSRAVIPLPRTWGDRHPGTGPGPGPGGGDVPAGRGGVSDPAGSSGRVGRDGTARGAVPSRAGSRQEQRSVAAERHGPCLSGEQPPPLAGVSFSPASACWKLAPAGGPVCARILALPARPFLSGFYPWGIFCDACVVHSG